MFLNKTFIPTVPKRETPFVQLIRFRNRIYMMMMIQKDDEILQELIIHNDQILPFTKYEIWL